MSTDEARRSSAPAEGLMRFSAPVAEWFTTTFAAPTPAQARGWPAIADGDHALILAPTGSGKTLAAFLWAIDRIMTSEPPPPERRTRVVYVSPLRALAVDIDRNLRAPLRGIGLAAERLGEEVYEPTVGVRTGDTPAAERRRMIRTPPDILITTPESLYLYLTSKGRETLRGVDTVIVDEIHALAGRKRGSHLALSLERLEAEVRRGGTDGDGTDGDGADGRPAPQRIALSATQRPLEEIARFLGGYDDGGAARPVSVVDAGITKDLEVEVVVPVEDMSDLGSIIEDPGADPAAVGTVRRKSIWPAVHPRLLELILEHRSTLVFVNARRLAERLAARLNELHASRVRRDRLAAAGLDATAEVDDPDLDPRAARLLAEPVPELVRAHHGSLARSRRTQVEDDLKAGRVRGIVTTSSLELGIDMGAVDLVVQVASPGAVSRGLQRIGRSGHRVGEPSRGRLFPKYRGDLVETAVVVRRMHDGAIEATRYPRNPLDVLAQQIVAMAAMQEWDVEDLFDVVRRAAPFHDLGADVFHAVLDLLAGRYPSDEFSELRPRLVWDRVGATVRGRANAQMLAVTNPGTIPDRGLFGVFLPDGTRVGELDEEMVHESRPGETFVLGASTWRIEDITHDRVVVTPAPGQPGKMPFWHGDGPGRPAELGAALGAFVRDVHERAAHDRAGALALLRDEHGLDDWAADNLVSYLEEQHEATGVLPTDRTITVERFRDEIGDWRICLLSPFGAPVHAPWAMALERRLEERGVDPEIMWADDGIVIRVQEAVEEVPLEVLTVDPEDVEELVVEQLAGTALFTTIFREAAGRALLLPKRRPGQRTALWQQRQRAANLLQVASAHPSFPIILEATRECLQDVFDLPALKELLGDLRARRIRLVPVDTTTASPFASSLLFSWVGQYMYEYDAPLAERRAAALSLDRDLLRELLGGDELRELLDAGALADLELELQRLADGRRARGPDELHELLLDIGALTADEIEARSDGDADAWVTRLVEERRAIRLGIAGRERIAAAEDATRYRDALGAALPPGLPAAFTDPVDDPLVDLVSRYARTHGPFLTRHVVHRLGIPAPRVAAALRHLEQEERIVRGEFRPGGAEREWCDQGVLRRLRRRSLAVLRSEVEPVEPAALGRFLPAWHDVTPSGVDPGQRGGVDGLVEVLARLQGAPIPASVLEADVLPDRMRTYREADLDHLLAAGEVVWLGAEPLGTADGRVVLCFRDQAHLLAPPAPEDPPTGEVHDALRTHLASAGASFWPDLLSAAGVADQQLVLDALWDLVWAGEITNDTFAPVRALLRGPPRPRRGRPRPGRLRRIGPPAAQGRWSLTAPLLEPQPNDTEAAHARTEQLLERHGIVTREAVRVEAHGGGFTAVYPVLKAMEAAGTVRRGYFVEGLGGAQFAVAGAVERLRSLREPDGGEPAAVTLAATDPAQPYGAALPWPASDGHPGRTAGAYVVLVDGALVLHVERGGRTLSTFSGTRDTVGAWLPALRRLVTGGRLRKLEIGRIDGRDVHEHPLAEALLEADFTPEYRGLTLRP